MLQNASFEEGALHRVSRRCGRREESIKPFLKHQLPLQLKLFGEQQWSFAIICCAALAPALGVARAAAVAPALALAVALAVALALVALAVAPALCET